jgi:hypothetical protein
MGISFFKKKTFKKIESESITTIKATKPVKESSSFIGDFISKRSAVKTDYPILEEDLAIINRPKSIHSNSLTTHICISLDYPVLRPDLEFITNSVLDNKPIYKYIGKDFNRFDLPYEEVFSIN